MRNILLEGVKQIPVEDQEVELVERKGIGHPDSICDAILEEVSVALSQQYMDTFGKIVHHNIDKGLLVAGRASPKLGGGEVEEPMQLIFGDRAVYDWDGKHVDVGQIAEDTARAWMRRSLRFVDPDQHVVFQNEIKPGSPELTDLFERKTIGANDTSAAVGYAPLTATERLVKAAEEHLNSASFKDAFPEAGEDVKVMGYRRGREVILTIALAFVDRFVDLAEDYFAKKEKIRKAVQEFARAAEANFAKVAVTINTLDDPERGEGGMYLTVTGTSAEGGDSGQVGRGNRVNGVISLNRPMSTEAAAGKNPVSHVGKIYNLLAHRIADQVHQEVPGVRQVNVWLCSQIGQPIDQPLIAAAQLVLEPKVKLPEIEARVETVIEGELADIYEFTAALGRGEHRVW
ncbi:MAG: methionine adenosyltransferase [Anaerolineae bacterium]